MICQVKVMMVALQIVNIYHYCIIHIGCISSQLQFAYRLDEHSAGAPKPLTHPQAGPAWSVEALQVEAHPELSLPSRCSSFYIMARSFLTLLKDSARCSPTDCPGRPCQVYEVLNTHSWKTLPSDEVISTLLEDPARHEVLNSLLEYPISW